MPDCCWNILMVNQHKIILSILNHFLAGTRCWALRQTNFFPFNVFVFECQREENKWTSNTRNLCNRYTTHNVFIYRHMLEGNFTTMSSETLNLSIINLSSLGSLLQKINFIIPLPWFYEVVCENPFPSWSPLVNYCFASTSCI